METQKLNSCGVAMDVKTSIPVKIIQVPAKCGSITKQCPSTAKGVLVPPKIKPTGQYHQLTSPTDVPRLRASSSVVVKAMVATPQVGSANSQLQVTKPVLSQSASMNQGPTLGQRVMLTVPRATIQQPVNLASRIMQNTSPQLPANIQVPPGMMLIHSDSGQLLLVSRQALAQTKRGQGGVSDQVSRMPTPRVFIEAGNKSKELSQLPISTTISTNNYVTGVAREPAVVQPLSAVSDQSRQPLIHAVVVETKIAPPAKYSQETLESVKKCRNFLITLIKLASNDCRSANMANNVRGLVRSLLEGKLEAEEFTEQLYHELKSTPQPCLVPFLKKSLPAVRCLTEDPKLFIQQASSSTKKHSSTNVEQNLKTSKQVIQQPRGVTPNTGVTLTQSRNYTSKNSRSTPKHRVLYSGTHLTGFFPRKNSFSQEPPQFAFKASQGSYKEDDDINDVASMAGVNLREENAQILTSIVGSVVQSCQDQLFLSPNPVLCRIIVAGKTVGVTDVGPGVVALVSHATQEWLHSLLAKISLIAEHRKTVLKEDMWHAKTSDVRTQIRFMEEVESLKEKRKNEGETKKLLHFANIRSQSEDPQQQQLKQRAKELKQKEEAHLQHRQANLTALAAIGPPRKRPLEQTEVQVSLRARQGIHRVTRVMLRDLVLCMEQDSFLCHSQALYKALLRLP